MSVDSRPWILGIASSHNGAACLLHGDEIVAAVQEERLLRRKRAQHPGAQPSLAIAYCLEYANISAADLSMIVLSTTGQASDRSDDLALNPQLRAAWHRIPTAYVGHHMAHAIGAFATSGFAESAVLVIDGHGSTLADMSRDERDSIDMRQVARATRPYRGLFRETISIYAAHDCVVQPIEKHGFSPDRRLKAGMRRFWSLGEMYEAVAKQIFGSGLDGAGKLMGLAPYGTPTTPPRDFYAMEHGQIDFHDLVPDRYLHDDRWPSHREEYQNLAASTQRALEDALFVFALRAREVTGARRLCYAGGVALNSVANEMILRGGGFDDVFIMPAAEDSGTAIGAAYYGLWQLTHWHARQRLVHDAVGRRYHETDVTAAIARTPCIHVIERGSGDAIDQSVDLLCDGKILGWFQGRSELGPRALGQRSIVCDPRRPEMKDLLNRTVKFREEFRPFAPVILRPQLSEWFDGLHGSDDSPFMLRVLPFRQEKRSVVPAVVHVDGTGRVQTVTPEANGRFYELVDRFYRRTGCPILLNTSFNVAGEPIVETPDDALRCLLMTGLDACLLEDWLVLKESQVRSPLDLVPRLTIDTLTIRCPVASVRRATPRDVRLEVRFLLSERWARVDSADRRTRIESDVVQIVTETRWGPVLHVINVAVIEILTRIDGKRTGWDLLDLLREEVQPDLGERDLATWLAALGRASVVDFVRVSTAQSWRDGRHLRDTTELSDTPARR